MTASASQIADEVIAMTAKLKQTCQGIDEATAGRAPEGRWTPKQILSHLCGPEGGFMPALKAFLDADTPLLDMTPDDPFYTPARAKMSFAELLAAAENEYNCMAKFAAALTPEQLARTARIPMLKDSPLGEYPSLGTFIQGLVGFHVQFHIDHINEVVAQAKG